MSSKTPKDQGPISYQALLDENRALKDENHALKAEIESLKAILEEVEELKRTTSEGDLECKRAEETVIVSEERYRSLFNSIDDGICIIEKVEDKMGRPLDFLFLEANSAFVEQSGVSDIVGKTIRQVFPEEAEEWINTYGTVLKTGEQIMFERDFASQGRVLELYAFRIESEIRRRVAVVFKDITERKRAEEKLQHAYARLRAVFDRKIDGIGIVIVNVDGNVLEANDYYLHILGFSREELEAGVIRWLEATPPEWLSVDEKAISELRKHGVCTPYEKEYIRRDGSRIPVLIAGSIFPGDHEEILGFVLDITEHKLAEEALHQTYKELQMQSEELEAQARELHKANEALSESEKRYRLIFDNSMDAIILTDPRGAGKVLSANPATYRMLGCSDKELIGKMRDGIFGPENPAVSAFLDERAHSGSARVQIAYRRKDGTILIGELSSNLFTDINGEPRSVTIIRDITERKQAEDVINTAAINLARAEKLANLGHWDWDLTTNNVKWSDGHFSIFGYNVAHGTETYEMWRDRVHPEDIEGVERMLWEGMEKDTGYNWNYRLVLPDGSIRYIHGEADRPVKDASGKPVRWFGIVQDITEQKLAEEALKESRVKLETALDSITDAVFISDAEGQFIDFNDAFATFHRFKNKEECARAFAEYPNTLDVFMADGTPAPVDMWAMPRALRGEKVTDAEYTLRRKDTGEIWIGSYSFAPICDKDGVIVGSVVVGRDITKRKAAEAELSYRREVLQRIFDNIPVLLVMWDPHLEQFTLNHHAEEVLGWTTADVNDGDFMTKVYPDDVYRAEVSTYMLSLTAGWREWICTTKDGQHVPIDWANIFLTDNTMIGIGVDLRERKVAEEALRESEKRFKILSEANALLLSSKDPETMIQTIAEKVMYHLNCDVFFNYVFDKVSGRLHLNAYYGINKEAVKEIEWLDEGVAICGCVAREGCRVVSEDVQHNGDNRADLVRSLGIQAYACHPLHIGEKAIGTLSFGTRSRKGFTDNELALMSTVADQVSVAIERKRAEEALKKTHEILEEKVTERTAELEEAYNSLLENEMRLNEAQKIAHLGNWDWNLLTDKLYWSDEMYRIFKVDPLEFGATYNAFLSYVHPDDRAFVDNTFKESLRGKPFDTDYRIISANGEERTVYTQAEVIFDDKHTRVRMRGILQDITERKKAEETLERMDKIRIKEIHHRIKNNLQVISSLLDIQAEKFEEEKVREAFREGQNRVVSMSLLHEELYKGGETDTLDFSAYLKKLAENLFQTYNLNSKNVHLSINLEENAFLDMDTAVPLGIIVNELISNSLKHAFTEKQEGEVRIKLYKEEPSNEMHQSLFSLTISDNGKGIPETIELENAESLGLQLVSILVDQLDGEIEFKREQGTEFRITFNVDETSSLSD